MIIVLQIFILAFILVLAAKDAYSYLLENKNIVATPEVLNLKDKWHLSGAALFILYAVSLAIASGFWWELPVLAILIRLSFYDITFNFFAKLSLAFIGTTAKTDLFLRKIFGKNGAIIKSVIAFILLILFNMLIKH